MAKKTDTAGKACKITLPAPQTIGSKSERVPAEKSVAVRDLAQAKANKSYTFHGDSKITTSGVPIKSR
jgi:hypothetical protein